MTTKIKQIMPMGKISCRIGKVTCYENPGFNKRWLLNY